MDVSAGASNYAGESAVLWSRSADSYTRAYFLWSRFTDISASYKGNRYVGRSLRCLYLGSV